VPKIYGSKRKFRQIAQRTRKPAQVVLALSFDTKQYTTIFASKLCLEQYLYMESTQEARISESVQEGDATGRQTPRTNQTRPVMMRHRVNREDTHYLAEIRPNSQTDKKIWAESRSDNAACWP